MIDAAEAYRIGLVNAILSPDELPGAARAMMSSILKRGPLAVAACIQAVNRGLEAPLDEGLEVEADAFSLLASTSDMREGMSAFLEKRAPSFKGQ
jgi:enoyl-CoA hydratase